MAARAGAKRRAASIRRFQCALHPGRSTFGRRARPTNLLGGGSNLGLAGDDHLTLRIQTDAVEHEPSAGRIRLARRRARRHRVADPGRVSEPEGLAEIDRVGSRQRCAEQSRDQRSAPQTVCDHPVEAVGCGAVSIKMGGIRVAGDRSA
jgi:hypothetical protein